MFPELSIPGSLGSLITHVRSVITLVGSNRSYWSNWGGGGGGGGDKCARNVQNITPHMYAVALPLTPPPPLHTCFPYAFLSSEWQVALTSRRKPEL